jgi:hypothetical protein
MNKQTLIGLLIAIAAILIAFLPMMLGENYFSGL